MTSLDPVQSLTYGSVSNVNALFVFLFGAMKAYRITSWLAVTEDNNPASAAAGSSKAPAKPSLVILIL